MKVIFVMENPNAEASLNAEGRDAACLSEKKKAGRGSGGVGVGLRL